MVLGPADPERGQLVFAGNPTPDSHIRRCNSGRIAFWRSMVEKTAGKMRLHRGPTLSID